MGRLIRGEQDHGQFVILDPRLWTKNYGDAFLQIIPVKIEKISKKRIEKEVKRRIVMIQDDTKQTIKFVTWVISLIIIAFFVSIAIFLLCWFKK